jgi:hypothetical protein
MMADWNSLPGAKPMTLDQVAEIVKGRTIKGFSKEAAQDPDQGGECIRFLLGDGDQLIFIAVPTPLSLDGITARIQPLLVQSRRSTLHT